MKKYLFLVLAVCLTTGVSAQSTSRKSSNEHKARYIKMDDIKGERTQNPTQVTQNNQRKKPVARRRRG